MILDRVEHEDGSVTFERDGFKLGYIHPESVDCYQHGCCVHFPTPTTTQNRENWPFNWRPDRGIMERLCPHGVGHDDEDSVAYRRRLGDENAGSHGCDGCCA